MQKKYYKKYVASILAGTMFIANIPSTPVFAATAGPVVDSNFDFDVEVSPALEYENGSELVDVKWDPVEFKYPDGTYPPTHYYVVRRKVDNANPSNTSGEYGWEIRGNYDTDEPVKVLNIYPATDNKGRPTTANGLKSWMENLNSLSPTKVNIECSSLSVTDFNANPTSYLYEDSDGEYNYDVVVFGFWDFNGDKDLNAESDAVIRKFIESDGGVLLGHDTLQYIYNGSTIHPYFSALATDYLGLTLSSSTSAMQSAGDYSTWVYSSKIQVEKQSTLTTYPFDIYGEELAIPQSHTLGQFPIDESQVYMTFTEDNFTDENGPYYDDVTWGDTLEQGDTVNVDGTDYIANAYLLFDDNMALIQCGHSSGQTTLAEQKVLGNTVYALNQVVHTTHSSDYIMDTYAPSAPVATIQDGTSDELVFNAEDNGGSYIYRVIAAPRGASLSNNWDTISQELNESKLEDTWTDSEGNQFAFSSISAEEEVFAGLSDNNTYEYYVDNKPVGEKREGTVIKSGDTVKIPTIDEGLTEDQFLHIWAYDNANNFSAGNKEFVGNGDIAEGVATSVTNGVTNINLYDAVETYTIIEKYVDEEGNQLSTPYTSVQNFGSIFKPNILDFDGYMYESSNPTLGFKVESDIEVTHTYKKSSPRDIYTVKHQIDSNGNETTSPKVELRATIENIDGGTVTYSIPKISDYAYIGYTIGSENGDIMNDPAITDGETCTFTWDSDEPIFIHYTTIPASVTVSVIDSKNGIDYGSYEYPWFEGKILTISDVYSKIPVVNSSGVDVSKCYSNDYELTNEYSVFVTADNSDDFVIDLEPEYKSIIYYGRKFPNSTRDISTTKDINNTSGTSVTVSNDDNFYVLGTQEVYFDGEETNILVKNIEGNLINSLTSSAGVETDYNYWNVGYIMDPVVDYTSPESMVYVPFYKGSLPLYTFSYETQYLNKVDFSDLANEKIVKDITLANFEPIEVKEFINMTINGVDGVNFDFEYIELVDNTTGNTKTFGNGTEYNYGFEEFYKYLPEISTDGTFVSDDYTVKLYYQPDVQVTYNEYITDYDGENAELNSHKSFRTRWGNSAVYNNTLPETRYVIESAVINGSTVSTSEIVADDYAKEVDVYYRPLSYDLTVNVKNKANMDVTYLSYTFNNVPLDETVTFNIPNYNNYTFDEVVVGADTDESQLSVNGTKVTFDPAEEGIYNLDLTYKQEAKAKILYVVNNKGIETIMKEEVKDVYVGDTYKFMLPNDYTGYTLTNFYVNGTKYDATNFLNNEQEYTIADNYSTIKLVYVPNSTGGDGGDGGSGGDGEDGGSGGDGGDLGGGKDEITTDPVKPIKPVEPVKPVEPIKPVIPTIPTGPVTPDDIVNLVNDPVQTKVRAYIPYIQGYPDGEVKPENSISRAEVMQVVYNLYGYGLFRDEYSNLDSLDKYSDIQKDAWYSSGVAFCIDLGVVNGYSDGTMKPNEPITRAELSSIISQFVLEENNVVINDTAHFSDIDNSWAKNDIDKLYKYGIVAGYSDGTFLPQKHTTRAEFVTMVNRLIERPEEYYTYISYPDLTKKHWAYDEIMNASNGGVLGEDLPPEVIELIKKSKNK